MEKLAPDIQFDGAADQASRVIHHHNQHAGRVVAAGSDGGVGRAAGDRTFSRRELKSMSYSIPPLRNGTRVFGVNVEVNPV